MVRLVVVRLEVALREDVVLERPFDEVLDFLLIVFLGLVEADDFLEVLYGDHKRCKKKSHVWLAMN